MEPIFNLIDERWIPCIWLSGDDRPESLSLRDTLTKAHRINEIYHDSPLTIAALYRLLLAITHDVFGPPEKPNWSGWIELWEKGHWDEELLEHYFIQYHNHFYLFHEQTPFYQVTEFPPNSNVQPKSIANLARELTSGSNTTLFDHSIDANPESIQLAEAALRLVTTQSFALGGGNSGIPGNNFRHAICAKGALFLVQGKSLFHTLLLNMIEYPSSRGTRMRDTPRDSPSWRMGNPFERDRHKPNGYLDFLTWQSRRIQLILEEQTNPPVVNNVYLTQGLWADNSVLDPLKNYYLYNKAPIPYSFDEDKALWRDSVTLFELQAEEGKQSPENFHLLSSLVNRGILQRGDKLRYLALGQAIGAKGGDVVLWRYERMPLPLEYLVNEDAVGRLRNALQLAEKVEGHLKTVRDWLIWQSWAKPKDKPVEDRPFHKWRKAKDYICPFAETVLTLLNLSPMPCRWRVISPAVPEYGSAMESAVLRDRPPAPEAGRWRV